MNLPRSKNFVWNIVKWAESHSMRHNSWYKESPSLSLPPSRTHTHTHVYSLSAKICFFFCFFWSFTFLFSLLSCCRWLAFYVNNIKFNIVWYIEGVWLVVVRESARERWVESRAESTLTDENLHKKNTPSITIVIVFRLTLSQCSECEKRCMRRRLFLSVLLG